MITTITSSSCCHLTNLSKYSFSYLTLGTRIECSIISGHYWSSCFQKVDYYYYYQLTFRCFGPFLLMQRFPAFGRGNSRGISRAFGRGSLAGFGVRRRALDSERSQAACQCSRLTAGCEENWRHPFVPKYNSFHTLKLLQVSLNSRQSASTRQVLEEVGLNQLFSLCLKLKAGPLLALDLSAIKSP